MTVLLINISDVVRGVRRRDGRLWFCFGPVFRGCYLQADSCRRKGSAGTIWTRFHIPQGAGLRADRLASRSVARFTRTLGTLIAAGVPILEASRLRVKPTGNEVYANMLGKVHDGIREGDTFCGAVAGLEARSTGIVVNMVDVGEETGELDKMLMKVADNYDEEVDTLVASLVSLLEPIMVVALGLYRRFHRGGAVPAAGDADRVGAELEQLGRSCSVRDPKALEGDWTRSAAARWNWFRNTRRPAAATDPRGFGGSSPFGSFPSFRAARRRRAGRNRPRSLTSGERRRAAVRRSREGAIIGRRQLRTAVPLMFFVYVATVTGGSVIPARSTSA
jgi:hypothetical protein